MPSPRSPDKRTSSSRFIDPAALLAIQDLELRAKVIVEGALSGLHRSPFHGFSVEFTEYRQYTPGDDPRYLDWRLVGRSDRYYIKKFEDETNLRCMLLVDQSRSMAYGEPLNKLEYANTLAATFAYFLQQQRDAAGLLSFDEIIREYLPARFRPGHLRQLLLLLDKPASGGKTDLLRPLDRIADLLRKRGMIVVISDFLFSLEDLQKQLRRLRAYGHEVSLFQILHPSELQLNLSGALMLEDLESEQRLYIDPHFARAPYIEKLTAHLNRLKDICRNLGIPVHLAPTDQPLERSLLHFLSDRQAVS